MRHPYRNSRRARLSVLGLSWSHLRVRDGSRSFSGTSAWLEGQGNLADVPSLSVSRGEFCGGRSVADWFLRPAPWAVGRTLPDLDFSAADFPGLRLSGPTGGNLQSVKKQEMQPRERSTRPPVEPVVERLPELRTLKRTTRRHPSLSGVPQGRLGFLPPRCR
jgi:hypothetical protein